MFDSIEQPVVENKHPEINEFLRAKKSTGVSGYTLQAYSNSFKYFFHDYFPDLKPEEAQVHHFEQFLHKLEDNFRPRKSGNDTISISTKRSYLSNISSFYTWAMKRPRYENITGNPASIVLEELPRQDRDRPETATWENAKKVVNGIHDPRNKLAASIMAKTGCRPGEVVRIKTRNVNVENGFILLEERKNNVRTKVPIDDELLNFYKRYQLMRKKPDSEHLFLSLKGNQLSTDRVRTFVRESAVKEGVCEEAEKDFYKKFSPHTFRTVFTTLMRDQGMKPHYVKYIRGDKMKGGDMLDHYTRIDEEKVREEYLSCIKTLEL